MACDICFENFDHSLHQPLTLFRCSHTLCFECVSKLNDKVCPTCKAAIEETKPNWSILKLTPESEYDKQKKELETVLSEIISSQQFFENTTKKKKIEQINERVKLIKKQIEDKSNEHIKQININKKNLFTEIDKYAKELKKTLNDFKFSNQEQSLINIKETLVKNNLTLENIIAANQNFSANISKFRVESHEIIYKLNETFQFFPKMESKIEDDFIGKVKLNNFYKEYLDQAEDVYKEIKDQDLVDYKVVKVNKAIVNLEKAIEFCPELSRAYILMGRFYAYKENLKIALTYFDKALEREVHYNSLMDKAQILMKFEKENEAIVLIDKAIKLEPQMAMPHFFKGLMFTQNNEFEKALDSFAKTLELDATFMHNTELHSYKGRCFMELKMYKEAADSMTKAVQLEPHNIGFLNCLNKAKVLLNY